MYSSVGKLGWRFWIHTIDRFILKVLLVAASHHFRVVMSLLVLVLKRRDGWLLIIDISILVTVGGGEIALYSGSGTVMFAYVRDLLPQVQS